MDRIAPPKKLDIRNIKAVIFDFNGTMIFDSDIHRRVWYEFFRERAPRPVSYEEIRDHVLGRDNACILRHYLGESLSDDEIEKYTYEKEATYRRLCLEDEKRFRFVEGAVDFLDYLVQKAIPRTIATGSEINNVRFYFERLGLSRWFDFENVIYDSGTFPGKPAPDIYLRAAAALGAHPADCLVFEDALSGVLAAHNAGIGHIVAISETEDAAFYIPAGGVLLAARGFSEFVGFLDF